MTDWPPEMEKGFHSLVEFLKRFLASKRRTTVISRTSAEEILAAASRMKELEEALGEIAEKADNYLHAASLPLPPRINVEGLKGGMEEIKKIAESFCAQEAP